MKTMESKLRVAEIFQSIQGEGFTSGVPAVFLRLSGCNLLCQGEWICDTIPVWKQGDFFEIEQVVDKVNAFPILSKSGSSLIVTGGEPLLQQPALEKFFEKFIQIPVSDWLNSNQKENNVLNTIEMETNGTILPKLVSKYVDVFNCSPKLGNSGNPKAMYFKPHVLDFLVNECNTYFKFVISKKEDINSLMSIYGKYIEANGMSRTFLMPACDNIIQYKETAPMVAELCKEYGFRFSSRLQITIWNKTTGV